jgi:hypothetical protein
LALPQAVSSARLINALIASADIITIALSVEPPFKAIRTAAPLVAELLLTVGILSDGQYPSKTKKNKRDSLHCCKNFLKIGVYKGEPFLFKLRVVSAKLEILNGALPERLE